MEFLVIVRTLIIFASAFYLFVHIGLVLGLKRCKQTKSSLQPFVSVIVAARNEERNIRNVLDCLSRQSYTQYEIIIVNDRSADNTATLISDFQKHNPSVRKIDISSVSADMPAKKNALRAGISISKGEILCFTDADCFPPPTWIEELVNQIEPEVGLVSGYSPYIIPTDTIITNGNLKNIFFKFITYEEFRAAIWSSGAIGWNLGWLCTGRNLAYRRKVFDEVGGYEKIKNSISGDDDLFLQLVRRETNWEIRYVKTQGSFVPTLPPSDFRSFVEQRKRHFSASKVFTFPLMFFFFFYHATNLLLFFSPILFLVHLISVPFLLVSIIIKLSADTIVVLTSVGTFRCRVYRHSFVLMEVLYVLYNSFIGPLGIFKKFQWKQS